MTDAREKIDTSAIEIIFQEGLKAHLRNKYVAVLAEAKKKLEEEFNQTVTDGAELIKVEARRLFQTHSPMDQTEILIRILEVKK